MRSGQTNARRNAHKNQPSLMRDVTRVLSVQTMRF